MPGGWEIKEHVQSSAARLCCSPQLKQHHHIVLLHLIRYISVHWRSDSGHGVIEVTVQTMKSNAKHHMQQMNRVLAVTAACRNATRWTSDTEIVCPRRTGGAAGCALSYGRPPPPDGGALAPWPALATLAALPGRPGQRLAPKPPLAPAPEKPGSDGGPRRELPDRARARRLSSATLGGRRTAISRHDTGLRPTRAAARCSMTHGGCRHIDSILVTATTRLDQTARKRRGWWRVVPAACLHLPFRLIVGLSWLAWA